MTIEYTAHPYGAQVVFCQSVQEQRAACKKYKLEVFKDISGCSLQVGFRLPLTIVMVVLDGELQTLVHECAHATMMIMKSVGVRVTSSNGEAFCYLLDNMFAAFLAGFKEAE